MNNDLKSIIKSIVVFTIILDILGICTGLMSIKTAMFLFGIGFLVLCPVIVIFLLFSDTKSKKEVKSKNYFRDIDEKYTPAMASVLIDEVIEEDMDILATVLDLKAKNYLEIHTNNDDLDISITNYNTDSLYKHEKYIIDCLKNSEFINPLKFKEFVKKDCIDCKIIKESKLNYYLFYSLFISFIIAIILAIINLAINKDYLKILLGINILFIILSFSFTIANDNKKTEEGKKIAIKFKELKNYLKDYTLLSEKDAEYTNLVGRYLPFTVALGIATKIEKSDCDILKKYIKPKIDIEK